jgi:hypothetical protein
MAPSWNVLVATKHYQEEPCDCRPHAFDARHEPETTEFHLINDRASMHLLNDLHEFDSLVAAGPADLRRAFAHLINNLHLLQLLQEQQQRRIDVTNLG